MSLEVRKSHSYIQAVVDALANNTCSSIKRPLAILEAIEILEAIKSRAGFCKGSNRLPIPCNVARESHPGIAEGAPAGDAFPSDWAVVLRETTSIVWPFLVLTIVASGIVVNLGIQDTGLELAAIAQVHCLRRGACSKVVKRMA